MLRLIRLQKSDLTQFARGFLMGGADIIPGVSGGTVALILGIYERLITAISHVDGHLLSLIGKGHWRQAAQHLDLRFLLGLGAGILTGIACLAKLMRYLLLYQRMYTLAVFFGLILASSFLVMRLVQPRSQTQRAACYLLAALSALFAFWLVGLEQVGFHDHLGYFFLCGAIAICAMILPGISGSYILWLLGAYVAVTGIIEHILHFEFEQREILSLLVFAVGCAVGLIGFSKLLRWLLARAHMPIMALLGGFMIGSLRLMWPFQHDLTPETIELKSKRYRTYLPAEFDSQVVTCCVLVVLAMLAVWMLERWGNLLDEEQPTAAKQVP